MKKLTQPEEIWTLRPTSEHLTRAAAYAAITLPWTFNRMMLNTSSRGQRYRGLNIAKGIVAQEMLRRALRKRGVVAQVERKSYRDEDLFDFLINSSKDAVKLDIKSVNFYKDYDRLGREPLSPELICRHAHYPGPDWRRFFPMLVPHTQIAQDKEAYCFAIASSVDFRKAVHKGRSDYALTAYPYGRPLGFLSSQRLCLAREEADKGFYLSIKYHYDQLFDESIDLDVIGEWDGQGTTYSVTLHAGAAPVEVGPFSCVSSFQTSPGSYEHLFGRIEIEVARNDFCQPLFNTSRRNVNALPGEPLFLTREDFCNLILPDDYVLYVVGWIPKDEFLSTCSQYTGWIWPLDELDKYENHPWNQMTDTDRRTLQRKGFGDCISESGLQAGWMKTHGRGGGACCYYFPNIGYYGGVRETNLYVLPKDLYVMDQIHLIAS